MCATSVHCKKLFARHCRTAALDRIRSSAVAWFSTSLHRVAFSLSRAAGQNLVDDIPVPQHFRQQARCLPT